MRKYLFRLALAMATVLLLVACQGSEPTIVEVTRVVIETVEPETVEVTRVVTEQQEVEVTRVVEVEDPALVERRKTAIFDITEGAVADPEMWNPYAAGSRLDQGLIQAMAEPLFILNLESQEREIIPWLAESMESNEDGSVWTVKLREGIKWSDGETLDADDFLFTINMLLENPDLNRPVSFIDAVETVEQLDDLAVRFNLLEPDLRFGENNFVARDDASLIIVPEHVWADQDPVTFTNYDPEQGWPIFSGPYTLESASETEFTYVRDNNWWGLAVGLQDDLPAPEKLVWVAYGTPEVRMAAMAGNDLDSLVNVPLSSFQALQQVNGTTIAWQPELPYSWIDPCARNFHFNLTREPWNDPEMRMAINYAIDRNQIVELGYDGASYVSRHWLPAFASFERYVDLADAAGLYETYPLLQHDPEMAKAIIEDNGWVFNQNTGYYQRGGQQLAMTVASFDDAEMNRIASLIVEQLQAIGINASHDIQPVPTFIENLTNARLDTYVFFICGPLDLWAKMDAFSTRHIPAEGQPAAGLFANTQRWDGEIADQYSQVVAQMHELPPDSPELDALFVEATRLWLSEMPALPIAQAIKLVPFDETYWTNWPTAENPYIQSATWWQSAHMIIHNLEPAQ